MVFKWYVVIKIPGTCTEFRVCTALHDCVEFRLNKETQERGLDPAPTDINEILLLSTVEAGLSPYFVKWCELFWEIIDIFMSEIFLF